MQNVMGALYVMMIFIYPLAMPILTLFAMLLIAYTTRGILSVFGRAFLYAPFFTLILGPAVQDSSSGQFALPWWLHIMVGVKDVNFYIWQYFIVCLVGFILFGMIGVIFHSYKK